MQFPEIPMKKILAFSFASIIFPCELMAASAPWVGADLKGAPCKGGSQGYGPYNYVTQRQYVGIVEDFHFGPQVEQLIRPMQGSFAGDFDYTLRAIPNHHRALLSVIKYQIQLNTKIKKGQRPLSAVECYLQRAINFSKDDAQVYVLYAYYLNKIGYKNYVHITKLYEHALKLKPDSPKIMYSFGLFLIDAKNYNQALEIAKILYKNHKVPNGLKNELIRLKIWQEP